MYLDLISYTLAEGVSEEHLTATAKDVLENWMTHQEGFMCWQIGKKVKDGTYIDIVSWMSKEDAKKAEEKMGEIPNGDKWMACYEPSSIANDPINQITMFHKC